MKIPSILLLFITIIPLSSVANSYFRSIYLGTGFNLNVFADKKESIGYEAMAGLNISQSLALEAGYLNFRKEDNKGEKIDPFYGRVKYMLPFSDYSSLKVGVGVAYDDSDYVPLISIGAGYQLTDNWSFNINYQSLFDFDEENRDSESLSISLIYRFGDAFFSQYNEPPTNIVDKVKHIESVSTVIDSDSEKKIVKPNSSPIEKVEKPICHEVYQTHVINEGESLKYISKLFGISFDKIKEFNNNFFDKGRNPNLIYPGELVVLPYLDCNSVR